MNPLRVSVTGVPAATLTAPTASIAPTPVVGGATATLTLSGFTPNSTVSVTADPSSGLTLPAAGVPVDASGNATVAITTSAASPGSFTLTATDQAVPVVTASAPLTVTQATVSPAPAQVPVTGTSTITLSGFAPAETVDLTFGTGLDRTAAQVTVDGAGGGSLAVTGVTPGTVAISATGQTSGVTANGSMTVTDGPTATLPIDRLGVGGATVLDLAGFPPNTVVTLTSSHPEFASVPATVTTDAAGTAMVQVTGEAEGGPVTFTATDALTGATARSDDLLVTTPTATIDPIRVAAGSTATLRLSGYTEGTTVTLTPSDGAIGFETSDTVVDNGDGTYTVTVDELGAAEVPLTTTPATPSGTHTVEATDANPLADPAKATATATLAVTTPTATIAPTSVPAGRSATLTLGGFTPGSTVDLHRPGPGRIHRHLGRRRVEAGAEGHGNHLVRREAGQLDGGLPRHGDPRRARGDRRLGERQRERRPLRADVGGGVDHAHERLSGGQPPVARHGEPEVQGAVSRRGGAAHLGAGDLDPVGIAEEETEPVPVTI